MPAACEKYKRVQRTVAVTYAYMVKLVSSFPDFSTGAQGYCCKLSAKSPMLYNIM